MRVFLSLVLLALSAAACSPAPRDQTQVTVVVESDLTLYEQLTYVQVELLGRNAPDPQWFRVEEVCHGASGKRIVGSFSLTKKVSNTVRVRVTGHGPDRSDGTLALVSRTVDISFRDNLKYAVAVELAAACLSADVACGQEESCDPQSAACAPITKPAVTSEPSATASCIGAIVVPPAIAPPHAPDTMLALPDATPSEQLDATSPERPDASVPDGNPCVDGDGMCDARCTFRTDDDCRRERGEACTTHGQCESEQCEHGVCCDRACSGPCERCDLEATRGTCVAVDFSFSNDAAHCGGCNETCSDNHIADSCLAGTCAGICASGYADCNTDKRRDGCEVNVTNDELNCGACGNACSPSNVASAECVERSCVNSCRKGYADCNKDQGINDGCERDIMVDPQHCDGCNKRCAYPYCHLGICAERQGRAGMSSVIHLAANTFYAYYLPLSSGPVVALGAYFSVPASSVVSPTPNVRFALYEAGSAGPGEYVTQTLETPVLNADPTKPAVQRAITHAPVLIPRDIDADLRYFLVILADRDVDVYAETSTTNVYRSDAAQPFAQSTSLPPLRAEPGNVLDGFVFIASDE